MGKHQGQILHNLASTDERGKMKIAQEMGITESYISRLFKLPKLSDNIIEKASTVLNVDRSVFFDEDYMPDVKKMSAAKYEKRITELEESIKRLAAELEREKALADTMQKALKKYFEFDP